MEILHFDNLYMINDGVVKCSDRTNNNFESAAVLEVKKLEIFYFAKLLSIRIG